MGPEGWTAAGARRLDRAQAAGRASTSARLVGLAVLLVVAIGIGVVVVVGMQGDEQPAPDGDGQTVQGPRRGDTFFADPAGEFTLSLPSGFRPISTRGDGAGAGAREFPNDDESAAALDHLLVGVPRSVVLVAPDTRVFDGEFTATITLERLDTSGDAGDVDIGSGGAGLAPAGVRVSATPEVVALPAGDAMRVEYAHLHTDDELVRWFVPTADVFWMLTVRAADLAEFGGAVDAVADSFELLDPGPRPEPAGPAAETPSNDPVEISGPDSSFIAVVPGGWVHHVAGSGSPPLHEQLFPDDVAASGRLDDFLSTLTSDRTRMVAVDPAGWTVIPLRVAVVDEMPDVGPESTLDQVVEVASQAWVRDGGLLANEGRLAGATGEIGWFFVNVPGGALNGVQYVIPGPTSAWVVTVWSAAHHTERSLGDAIASGFTPG